MNNPRSLKSVSEIITKGTTPTTVGGNFTFEGINFVKSESINDSKYLDSSIFMKIDEETDEKLKRSRLKKDDLLFSIAGAYLGKISIVREQDLPANTNQAVGIVRTNKEIVDVEYIYYFFSQPLMNEYINRLSAQSSQPNLNLDLLGKLNFNYVKIEEQKKIASVLSAIDTKIELNNRINTELEAMAKTLYDYWFVQFDFPDANGKPYKTSGGKMVYNPTLKREIPQGWEVNELAEIANITMGQSPPGDSYNEDGIGAIFFQGSTNFGWLFPTTRQYTTAPARIAKKGDTLLSVRAPVGDMNIADNDCCIGRGLAALNSKQGYDGFLFYVMKYFKQVFDRRNSEGTTFGSITKDDLHSLTLAYPSEDLLKRYDEVVSNYNKMIFERSMENQQLIALRDWLLPMLMNGQVTVK
jgi:type I restriction enzyme S subunit